MRSRRETITFNHPRPALTEPGGPADRGRQELCKFRPHDLRRTSAGAVYDRSEHIAEAREISSFECAVSGETIENWNSTWVPRYRFIACPARDAE
jgi:hypothetical protein